MSNVLLCRGAYSKTPYYLKDDCINIYCIEELCYYLYHNAYLLDDSFVTGDLADWITKDLELNELGREVSKLCSRYGALNRLIDLLKNEIGYYSDDEWQALIDNIGSNDGLSHAQRRKIRADGFLEAKRYGMAMDEYELILKETRVTEVKLRAGVFHNLGVCAAGLFMYERASEYFERAYDTYANTESYVSMLSAKKLYMPPGDYLSFLAAHKESYEDSLEVERRFEDMEEKWKRDPSSLFINELEEKKSRGNDFYSEMDALTEEVKTQYREQIFRGRTGGF